MPVIWTLIRAIAGKGKLNELEIGDDLPETIRCDSVASALTRLDQGIFTPGEMVYFAHELNISADVIARLSRHRR